MKIPVGRNNVFVNVNNHHCDRKYYFAWGGKIKFMSNEEIQIVMKTSINICNCTLKQRLFNIQK